MNYKLSISCAALFALSLLIPAGSASAGGVGGVRIKSILTGSDKIDALLESSVTIGNVTATKVRWWLNQDSKNYPRVLAVLLSAKAVGDPIMWWDCGTENGYILACDVVQGDVWP